MQARTSGWARKGFLARAHRYFNNTRRQAASASVAGALCLTGAVAQAANDDLQQRSQEQERRAQERFEQLEKLTPRKDVNLSPEPSKTLSRIPDGEAPCFVIGELHLQLPAPDNNASADMAGFGSSAVRDFQPGTTHRAENINAGQVTDRDVLPRIDGDKTSMDQSQGLNHYDWPTQRPAWKEGTTVTDRVTTQPETYRMVVNEDRFDAISKALQKGDGESAAKNLGGWATKDTVTGVSDVRNNLAISSEWKGKDGQRMYVVEFTVQPGVGVREGVVGPMHDAQAKVTLPGGGHQVQFMDKSPYTNPNLFKIDLSKAKELK